MEGFLANKLPPYYKSQPIPELVMYPSIICNLNLGSCLGMVFKNDTLFFLRF